jgi:hypothetical protein
MIGGGDSCGDNNDTLTQLLFLWKSVCIAVYCKAFGTACSQQSNPFVVEDNDMIYGVWSDYRWVLDW